MSKNVERVFKMETKQELKNDKSHKEFQNLLDQDFKDRKLKENKIIKAVVTEITKNFVVVDCKAKMEGMMQVKNLRMMKSLVNLKLVLKLRFILRE